MSRWWGGEAKELKKLCDLRGRLALDLSNQLVSPNLKLGAWPGVPWAALSHLSQKWARHCFGGFWGISKSTGAVSLHLGGDFDNGETMGPAKFRFKTRHLAHGSFCQDAPGTKLHAGSQANAGFLFVMGLG